MDYSNECKAPEIEEGPRSPHHAAMLLLEQSAAQLTHLSVSGAKHFADKRIDDRQQSAVSFFMALARAPIPRIAIENPVCIMSSMWRKPDHIIQPWQYGHGETKATCLWLRGLPRLQATEIVEGREARVHRMPPSADRWKERSRTFSGIAAAMAAQWGRSEALFAA